MCQNGSILGYLGPGSLGHPREKSSDHIDIVCTSTDILVNIFSDTGQVVCEVREFVPPSSKHDHYVIDSIDSCLQARRSS